MLLDDPTFGVDIHAKSEIIKIVEEFAARGKGVVFVSSDLEELLLNCDRILVIKNGRIAKDYRDVLKVRVAFNSFESIVVDPFAAFDHGDKRPIRPPGIGRPIVVPVNSEFLVIFRVASRPALLLRTSAGCGSGRCERGGNGG